jgi:ATP-binding cassette subfamily B protein
LGVIALLGFIASLVMMYAGGMASHIAAFRILYGLRVKLSGHIGKLPLGWLNGISTGAVKKTLEQNVEKVETFIVHQLPDLVHVAVTTLIMIAAMFMLNAWLAIACVIPIVLAFAIQKEILRFAGADERVRRAVRARDAGRQSVRANGAIVSPVLSGYDPVPRLLRAIYRSISAWLLDL